jgi:hypothetical protein
LYSNHPCPYFEHAIPKAGFNLNAKSKVITFPPVPLAISLFDSLRLAKLALTDNKLISDLAFKLSDVNKTLNLK